MAYALGVGLTELTERNEKEDKGFLLFMHLSALSFLLFPLLCIVVPFIFWILKREKIQYMDETGKKLLNFQITWCITLLIIHILILNSRVFMFRKFVIGGMSEQELFLIAFTSISYLLNLMLITFNAVRSLRNKNVCYGPLCFF